MSNTAGRKKPRTKEVKVPVVSRLEHRVSVVRQSSSTAVDAASAALPSDAPYVCTGRFGVDFVQLCRRAQLWYIPVVARPHRPAPASIVADDKRTTGLRPFGKFAPTIQAPSHVGADQSAMVDISEGSAPEPPPKTYVVRDSAVFFRPSVQVSLCFTLTNIVMLNQG